MDHVKQCQFPSYSRKLGFTKKKCLMWHGSVLRLRAGFGHEHLKSGLHISCSRMFSLLVISSCSFSGMARTLEHLSICTFLSKAPVPFCAESYTVGLCRHSVGTGTQPSRWETQRERVKPVLSVLCEGHDHAQRAGGSRTCCRGITDAHRLTSQGPLPWRNIHELCQLTARICISVYHINHICVLSVFNII